MTAKRKKIQASGRFGAGYGTRARKKMNKIESSQRKKQTCPHCTRHSAIREAVGIWNCKKCKKRFTGPAYVLNN
jgi:large subunit ribosomal protein L37Ae